MQITVRLFAYFRDGRFKEKVMDFPQGTTVENIVDSLGINPQEVGITMINSRHCPLDQIPEESDKLAIFPVIGGG